MEPVREGMPSIMEDIEFCVAEGGSFVLDRADEKLATARKKRKESYSALTKQAEEIARSLFANKASETSQVLRILHRLASSVLKFNLPYSTDAYAPELVSLLSHTS